MLKRREKKEPREWPGDVQKPIHLKSFDEMNVTEMTDWSCGNLLVAIGKGDFRSALCGILMGVRQAGFRSGKLVGAAEERRRQKERAKARRK